VHTPGTALPLTPWTALPLTPGTALPPAHFAYPTLTPRSRTPEEDRLLLRGMVRFRVEHGPPKITKTKKVVKDPPPIGIEDKAAEGGEENKADGGPEGVIGDSEEWLRVMLRRGEINYPFKACMVCPRAI